MLNNLAMRHILSILCLCMVISCCSLLSSCGGGDSPVDRYVEIIDSATEKINEATSKEQLEEIQTGEESLKANLILEESGDYVLTKSDKEKLKKSIDKMLRALFKKSLELSTLPDDFKSTLQSQSDMAVEAVNKNIDNASTLEEISSSNLN